MLYNFKKNIGAHPEKAQRERMLTVPELRTLLNTVKNSEHPYKDRDHALFYLGWVFACRVSEVVMLERASFRNLRHHESRIRTSKNLPRLPVVCSCGKKLRVAASRIGSEHVCPKCERMISIEPPRGRPMETKPPEKIPPVVESMAEEYIFNYMKTQMLPNQKWFFPGQHGETEPPEIWPHLGVSQCEKVFAHWIQEAGLNVKYSWHSLRHSRGMFIQTQFKDLIMTRDQLRQKSMVSAEWYLRVDPEKIDAHRAQIDDQLKGLV